MRRLLALLVVTITLGTAQNANAGPFQDAVAAYNRGDYATSLNLWSPLATQGNVGAQSNLGVMYELGHGVPQNFYEAARWYGLAAIQGDATAQYNLALLYDSGQGVPQDYKEAVRLYRLAAAQGHAGAQYNLGSKTYLGEGMPQDYKEAVRWYRLASAQGHAMAQSNLGDMYKNGQGVPQNYVRAHMWYNLSASSLSSEDGKKAIENRNYVAAKMTPAQLEQAQEMARKCQTSKFKNCD